jgi:amidase
VLRLTPPRDGVPWRFRDRVLHWLDGHDLLIGPATATGPFPAGRPAGRRYLPALLRSAVRTPYTPAWNLAGLPAVVVPVLVAGRPIGVQLVGKPGDEHRLLAVAAQLEHRAVPSPTGAPRRVYV